jgi:hypothetical protein
MTGRSSQPSPANDLNQVLAKIGDRELHLRVAA